jgi:hypothetical protein
VKTLADNDLTLYTMDRPITWGDMWRDHQSLAVVKDDRELKAGIEKMVGEWPTYAYRWLMNQLKLKRWQGLFSEGRTIA